MVVVAVAGGTGTVGRNVGAAKETDAGTRLVATDYENVPALTKVLEDNNVHTVISTLNMMPNAAGTLEKNLIQAADASRMTKRLIPSEFGFPQCMEDGDLFPSIPMKRASQRALKASTLEWTIVYNGYFMDYFGMPKVPSYLAPYVVLLDIAGNTAAIPGDGNRQVTFTHISDVGKYIAASIDLENWDPVSYIIGDKMTLNEAVKLAEEVKGTKFKVDYDDLDKLKRGEVTELPSQKLLYSVIPKEFVQAINSRFGIWIERGDLDFDENTSLNKKFSGIKTMKLKELLENAWGN